MNILLEKIFETGQWKKSDGQIVQIHSQTRKEQCNYLSNLIESGGYSKTLEIGFAYGMSSLAIVDAVVRNKGNKHIIIDKFERISWDGVGLDILNSAGYSDNYEFHEEYCYKVLPKLLEQNMKFDFAYIDSTKQFDWLLVDFFYIDKMLETGGLIVFDDVAFPGIRRLARLIKNFPNYQLQSVFPTNYGNPKLEIFSKLLKLIPWNKKLFRYEWIHTDFSEGINSNCIAFKKINDDSRNWDWYNDF